jgi:hypothetical protein
MPADEQMTEADRRQVVKRALATSTSARQLGQSLATHIERGTNRTAFLARRGG